MLSAVVTMESSMSKAGLDNQHRNKDGENSGKPNILVRTLRKIYGQGLAAGYPETTHLSEVIFQLSEFAKPAPSRSRDASFNAQIDHIAE
jgi:hypothetical protein